MYDDRVRARAAGLRAQVRTWSQISRELGVSRSALRRPAECPRCSSAPLSPEAYAALLGFYLGDGCLSAHRRFWALQHWPCLFPQHGPGRKHDRPIVLEDWQRAVVEAHPGRSCAGCSTPTGPASATATGTVAGETKRYDYPRWQFANVSADIRELGLVSNHSTWPRSRGGRAAGTTSASRAARPWRVSTP